MTLLSLELLLSYINTDNRWMSLRSGSTKIYIYTECLILPVFWWVYPQRGVFIFTWWKVWGLVHGLMNFLFSILGKFVLSSLEATSMDYFIHSLILILIVYKKLFLNVIRNLYWHKRCYDVLKSHFFCIFLFSSLVLHICFILSSCYSGLKNYKL